MKKLMIVMCSLIWLGNLCVAQDVIVTKKSEKIDAKILEVGINEVKFKKFDYQDGPTFILRKSEIVSIIYQDGTVELFEISDVSSDSVELPKIISDGSPITMKKFNRLNRDDEAMDNYLQTFGDCDIADNFHSGMKFARIGKGLLIPGIILSGVGVIFITNGIVAAMYSNFTGIIFLYSGIALATIGEALVIASIPIKVAGGVKKKNAKNDFLNKYFNNHSAYTPTLNFNYTGNGFGMTLKF